MFIDEQPSDSHFHFEEYSIHNDYEWYREFFEPIVVSEDTSACGLFEHFLHDIGVFQIGIGATLLLALVWTDALRVALTGFAAGAGLHFVSHLMDGDLGGRPSDPVFFALIAAVVAGAVILNLGFALNLISAWRTGDAPRLWLDKNGVLGLALYWALLGGGLAAFSSRIPIGAWLALVTPLAAAMWFRGPLAAWMRGAPARVGAHLLTGFFELFEAIVAYLSNSLSFAWLGASAAVHEGLFRVAV
jgi:vacuolar-type H+-ATPase subunit I/STV1